MSFRVTNLKVRESQIYKWYLRKNLLSNDPCTKNFTTVVMLTFRAPWVITLVSGVWPLTLLLPQKILHKKTWKENLSLSFYSHSSHIPTLEYIRKQIIEYLLSIHFAYYVCISFFEEGCTFLTHSSQSHISPAGKLPLLNSIHI